MISRSGFIVYNQSCQDCKNQSYSCLVGFFKGQLISEAIFLGFKSPKKQTKLY